MVYREQFVRASATVISRTRPCFGTSFLPFSARLCHQDLDRISRIWRTPAALARHRKILEHHYRTPCGMWSMQSVARLSSHLSSRDRPEIGQFPKLPFAGSVYDVLIMTCDEGRACPCDMKCFLKLDSNNRSKGALAMFVSMSVSTVRAPRG